jgi:hypothetical protein
VELLFEMLEPDVTRKKQVVRDLLTLWQTNGNYFAARWYPATLSEEAGKVLEKKGSSRNPGDAEAEKRRGGSGAKFEGAVPSRGQPPSQRTFPVGGKKRFMAGETSDRPWAEGFAHWFNGSVRHHS